jgi:hypothetical protein
MQRHTASTTALTVLNFTTTHVLQIAAGQVPTKTSPEVIPPRTMTRIPIGQINAACWSARTDLVIAVRSAIAASTLAMLIITGGRERQEILVAPALLAETSRSNRSNSSAVTSCARTTDRCP